MKFKRQITPKKLYKLNRRKNNRMKKLRRGETSPIIPQRLDSYIKYRIS